jgi:S-adenosylmethionine-diacylgycerolhomoserine-N-methlytransferase
MSRYYGFQSNIYDATRWMFLYGRSQIINDVIIRPGHTVIEIGCGTGHNFEPILKRITASGKLIGVDCSKPMLKRASARTKKQGWKNIQLVDEEYGRAAITEGQADVVLMSYSLSMIPNWQSALKCAKSELKPGGTMGIVDFWFGELGRMSEGFAHWLNLNHVDIDRPYENVLTAMFQPARFRTHNAFAGLWKYFRFVGVKPMKAGNGAARNPES